MLFILTGCGVSYEIPYSVNSDTSSFRIVNLEEEEYFEAFDLSTPKNKQDALKSFLNRTK